jgi:hypothetical protein
MAAQLRKGGRMIELALSPLELDPLTRAYYGQMDAYTIAQLAPLAKRLDCYTIKFFKAPASTDELIGPYQYVACGLHLPPGGLIFGFFLPALVSTSNPPAYNVQITDVALNHTFWDQPVPSIFLGNYKPAYLTDDALQAAGLVASFPALFDAPHPITGDGLFLFEFWDTTGGTSGPQGSAQRIELVIGCLVPKDC